MDTSSAPPPVASASASQDYDTSRVVRDSSGPATATVPGVGQTVHYYENADMCVSPALVLNTVATARPEVLARFAPDQPDAAVATPIVALTDARCVDLLVHGLVRSYRRYAVPFSPAPRAGHWNLPA